MGDIQTLGVATIWALATISLPLKLLKIVRTVRAVTFYVSDVHEKCRICRLNILLGQYRNSKKSLLAEMLEIMDEKMH